VAELNKESKDLINQLKALNENIDLLTKVTAISVGKETIFKGKKEMGDKVDALDGFDLPDRIIAMLVGSTPDSVKSLRSRKKTRMKKTEPKQAVEKHDEQKAV
jgi:PDZ domain-containing secreted protein